jgi:drug/metabolite transporter (DMT)-like permease
MTRRSSACSNGSALGFILWYEGASRTRTSEAALMTAVMPVAALALAVIVLGETVTALQGIGCAMVVIAIILGIGKSE